MAQTSKSRSRAGKKASASKKPAKSAAGRTAAPNRGRKSGGKSTTSKSARGADKQTRGGGSFLWRATKALISLGIWGVIALAAVLVYYGWNLPDVTDIDVADPV